MSKVKTGLVLEGGAMRGIFSAGVLDYMLKKDIYYDYVIGVSAGAGNAVNYVSRQEGRTKKIITHENAETIMESDSFLRIRRYLILKCW
ncbi:MAG: patatin-like phospholipase family protein [Lachnospira eligens]